MSSTRVLAILLILLGAVILAYPAITYTTKDKVVDIGPVEVTKTETHRVPLSPILGGVALAAGAGLLLMGARKTA